MRSTGTISVQMLGLGSSYKAVNLQAENLYFSGEKSDVEIGQMLVGTASLKCQNFTGSKLSIAKRLELKAADSVKIRSLIMQDGESFLTSRTS